MGENYEWSKRGRQQRNQTVATVGTSDTVIAGPNPKRRGLLIGSPLGTDTGFVSDGTLTSAADTSTTGAKSTYTVPAGVQARLKSASMVETTGTTVVAALQLVRSGVTLNVATITKSGTFTGDIPLLTGDVVQWNVTTAVALSVTDFGIFVDLERVPVRVTISFIGAAVAEKGITLSPGTLPLYLHEDNIGSGITEDIHAIASQAGVLVPVLDVFDA